MKILMLGWELPPHNSGGLGVACYQLSRALAEHGAKIEFVLPHALPDHDIDFMKLHAATPLAPTKLPGAYSGHCQACPVDECSHGDFERLRSLQSRYLTFIDQHLQTARPDIIHAHDWLTLEAGVHAKRVSGAPLVAHVHATEFDRAGGDFGNPLIHDIEQTGLMMADQIIAVSHATKRIIVDRYQIPADKIEVVHNSIDALPADTSTAEDLHYTYLKTMQREGYLVVTTVGRLTRQKGLRFFLQAAALAHRRLDRFVFVIAGDGEERDQLIEMSADLGIADKVIFTGFIRGQAWRDIFALSDVFVMSSVSEPFGLTALEAAQLDTAISLTRQSGVGEVLHNVLRYDYWDDQRLADQLVNLAASQSLRRELADNVGRECAQLSWRRTADRLMGHYRQLRPEPIHV